ncbi:PREDICTED: uncharacterized protein LOC109338998 isoform X2 [Lupinus angustifolius]|uniref:uncharacterized protein LOC109338998 isoform X2 n=1 Tax=Lupinus angustifolius TaxID=3871 RepID=UPI00092F9F87|nr:PREDICTED: uncharacterized protein LOC109338998 isoform X2 [Lupinus angustifolius]
MRCFRLPCFGSKIKKSSNPPPQTFAEENHVQETIHYITQMNAEVTFTKEVVVKNCEGNREEEEEEKAASEDGIPHKVEKKQVHAIKDILDECASESLFSLSIDSNKQVSLDNVEVNSPMQKLPSITKVEYDAVVTKSKEQPNLISIRVVNNSNSSEESSALEESNESVNIDESDFDVTFEDDEKKREGAEDVNRSLFQEESSESLFSLSIDSRKRISSAENLDGEVNSLIVSAAEKGRRIKHDDSAVLNPIENITTQQGKVKATMCKTKENKENINLVAQDFDIDHIPISPEPNLKLSSYKTRKKQEIGVDTSLSSWLVEPETTPITMKSSNYSARKHTRKEGRGSSVLSNEDRPILGALSIEVIRKYSSVSATCSRSRSLDEIPIIGTVGSYWSHTGKCMDSELDKHRKDARLKCSSTIKRKLERTFEDELGHFPVQ